MKPVSTYVDILNEIKMSYPVARGAVFILLEGESDIKFYKRLFDENACKIYSLPGGKVKLEEGLSELTKKYPLVIGIRDADFLHLERKTASIPNLFMTDYHDSEMLMVAADEVFSSVASEFCTGDKTKHSIIRSQLLAAISFIGYLRWYNDKNDLGLKFSGLKYAELFNHQTCIFDQAGYVAKLLHQSPHAKVKDPATIEQEVNSLMDVTHELFQLCNGHDFMKVMALYATKINKGDGVNEHDVKLGFRTAYTTAHFRQTGLYHNTLSWASAHEVNIHYN